MERNIELEKRIRIKIYETNPKMNNEDIDALVNIIFKICPQELEQNVWEWIENKPYSDIKYCGLSINDLFKMRCNKQYFIRAIDVLYKVNKLSTTFGEGYSMEDVCVFYLTSPYRC